MADELRLGSRVKIKEKNLEGTIRFIGTTLFAPGKWIGVELDEPKGKNNGIIQGKEYFHCENNSGLMVRLNQLQIIPEIKTPSHPPRGTGSGIPTFTSKRPGSGKKLSPQSTSATSPRLSKQGIPARSQKPPQVESEALLKASRMPHVEVEKDLTSSGQGSSSGDEPVAFGGSGTVSEPEKLSEFADLTQRLAILQSKRAEDKARIKELEKFKMQYAQLTEYKQRWSESQSDLQQQLKAAKKEVREHQLAKEKAEEEMRDLMDTVEMATLDKEMAEERSESLQAEVDALKEKVEELTIELEVIKEEISEGGVEGAAANAQFKQMEQQNNRLKEALLRLRDLSAQDKLEQQRIMKDLEKTGTALLIVKDQKETLARELAEADAIIDELKDQVDAALGAEEMVEKMTDTNLELEGKLEALSETVADLEALRDLSEEQEEIRMEVEHDLREELDMSLNSVRQMEQKLEAAQETIVDQQQTIEKFRDLVRNLNADLKDLRSSKVERGGSAEKLESNESKASVTSLTAQLKSAVKAQARTIDFELRKLDTQQAAEQINLLISFMPSTFLITGGDYDALLVLMLLPRMSFKAELIIDQLKQQYNYDELIGSTSAITPAQLDKLAFVSDVVLKLVQLNMLVNRANNILKECDVHLYRQMGGVRDDLSIHEKVLDALIDLLKKEQLDESIPLINLDKAISHLESLLERRLRLEEGTQSPFGCAAHLLNQMSLLSSSCDLITLQLLRVRSIVPEGSTFAVQLKEMETINGDIRQNAKKVRRKGSTGMAGKILVYDDVVASRIEKLVQRQVLYVEAFSTLHVKASQKANSLSEGEKLASGIFDEFIRQIVASRVLQEFASEVSSLKEPKEMLGKGLSITLTAVEQFLSALSEGKYDALDPKLKVEAPVVVRARAVKAELSDVEGLGFKLEERQQDIVQLKKSLKMKAQEVSEANVKTGLLEKKAESIDAETKRKVKAEKDEVKKLQDQLERQKEDFRQTIFVLQGDIETLEAEKVDLEKKLKLGPTHYPDTKHGPKIRMVGPTSSSSPFLSRKAPSSSMIEEFSGDDSSTTTDQSPLLLARIESLSKALGFSINENFRLKAKIAKAQLNSLAPLKVPHRLVVKPSKEEGKEETDAGYHTDQEKNVLKKTSALIDDLKRMCLHEVVDTQKTVPAHSKTAGGADGDSDRVNAARERLSNSIVGMFEMQRRLQALREDAYKVVRSQCPGSAVDSSVATFNSPQFSKVLAESKLSDPTAIIRLMSTSKSTTPAVNIRRIQLSPAQFYTLHETVVS